MRGGGFIGNQMEAHFMPMLFYFYFFPFKLNFFLKKRRKEMRHVIKEVENVTINSPLSFHVNYSLVPSNTPT